MFTFLFIMFVLMLCVDMISNKAIKFALLFPLCAIGLLVILWNLIYVAQLIAIMSIFLLIFVVVTGLLYRQWKSED